MERPGPGGHAGDIAGAGAGLGGAIYNQGTLLFDGVTATGNVAQGDRSAESGGGDAGTDLGVTDLQRRFKSVFDEVAEEGIPYVLTRGSRPEAALVPYEEYRKLQESKEREVLFEVDRLLQRRWEASEEISEEEVAVDVRAARDEARKR